MASPGKSLNFAQEAHAAAAARRPTQSGNGRERTSGAGRPLGVVDRVARKLCNRLCGKNHVSHDSAAAQA